MARRAHKMLYWIHDWNCFFLHKHSTPNLYYSSQCFSALAAHRDHPCCFLSLQMPRCEDGYA